jgi:deoxyadenosine/deoxycytidine kinase
MQRSVLQERVIEEHVLVFGAVFRERGYLDDDDYAVAVGLLDATRSFIPAPALLVHIEIDPATALERIRSRGRASEAQIDLQYLQQLAARYEHFMSRWDPCAVLRLDAREFDFREAADAERVSCAISEALALRR